MNSRAPISSLVRPAPSRSRTPFGGGDGPEVVQPGEGGAQLRLTAVVHQAQRCVIPHTPGCGRPTRRACSPTGTRPCACAPIFGVDLPRTGDVTQVRIGPG